MIGWLVFIALLAAVSYAVIAVSARQNDQEQEDREQEEFLRQWNRRKR